MSQYYKISQEPMTKKERNKLRNGLFFLPIFVIGPLIFYFVMADEPFRFTIDTGTYIFLGFGLFFYGILGFIARSTYLDWKSGTKDVIKGIVTRKEHTVHRKKKGGSTHRYYLHFDDFRLHVKLQHYGSVNEGDLVTFHYGKRTHVIFDYEINQNNALADLQQKGVEMAPPKAAPKGLSFVQSLMLFVVLAVAMMTGLFSLVADCFMCGPEYKESITGWQGYQTIETTDDISMAANKIMLMMSDTLKDVEEHEIATTFEVLSAKGQSGQLIEFLAGYHLPNDTISALIWMREKFDEDVVRYPTTVIEIWNRILPFSIGDKSAVQRTRRKENLVRLSHIQAQLFIDRNITIDQLKLWYGQNRSLRDMQYILGSNLPKDTTDYADGTNALFREVFSKPMSMNASDRPTYRTARMKYGLE